MTTTALDLIPLTLMTIAMFALPILLLTTAWAFRHTPPFPLATAGVQITTKKVVKQTGQASQGQGDKGTRQGKSGESRTREAPSAAIRCGAINTTRAH